MWYGRITLDLILAIGISSFQSAMNDGETFSTPPDDNLSQNTGSSAGPQISSEGENVYVIWND